MFIMKCYKELRNRQDAGKQLKLSEVDRLKYLLKDAQITELNNIIKEDEELNNIESAFQMSFINETYSEGLEDLIELLIKDMKLVREQNEKLLKENKELKDCIEEIDIKK